MSKRDDIREYLDRLEADLRGRGFARRRIGRIVAETRDHLEETAERLARGGMTPDAARREAVHRFGAAGPIAAAFDRLAERKEKIMLIYPARAIAVLTMAFAGLIVFFELANPEVPAGLMAVKLALACGILTQGALTMIPSPSAPLRRTTRRGAAGLAALGVCLFLFSGAVSFFADDPAYYMIPVGALMAAQGALTWWALREGPPPEPRVA